MSYEVDPMQAFVLAFDQSTNSLKVESVGGPSNQPNEHLFDMSNVISATFDTSTNSFRVVFV